MPRPKKLPPFVPLPWISDLDTSSTPGSTVEEFSDSNSTSNVLPGVHPGLHLPQEEPGVHPDIGHFPQDVAHLPQPPVLRVPIDAERGCQHFAGQSQGTTLSHSPTLPSSSFPSLFPSEPTSDQSFTEDSVDEFTTVLEDLVKQWLLIELTHSVSKHATESFWKLALEFFPLLTSFNGKKILQFQQLRKKLYTEYVPDISMCVTFQDRSTDELHILQDITSIPKNRFPPQQSKKLYETAKVQASF